MATVFWHKYEGAVAPEDGYTMGATVNSAGTPSFSGSGKWGSAMSMLETGFSTNMIYFTGMNFTPTSGLTNFSVGAWFYNNGWSASDGLVSGSATLDKATFFAFADSSFQGGTNAVLGLYGAAYNWGLGFESSGHAVYKYWFTNVTLPANDWYHLALVINSAGITGSGGKTIQVYLNGNVICDATDELSAFATASTFWQGAVYDGANCYWSSEGLIDNVKIYDSEKTNWDDRSTEGEGGEEPPLPTPPVIIRRHQRVILN